MSWDAYLASMTVTQTPPVEKDTSTEEIPQLAPGLPLTKERVRAVVDDFPESFTLDDLVLRLIALGELDKRLAQADKGHTVPHDEVMSKARARLERLEA